MRILERCYPFVVSGIVFVFMLWRNWKLDDVKEMSDILNSTITLSSIIIALLATMISILISLTDKKVMVRIKANRASNLLYEYLNLPIVSGLILTCYSIILYQFKEYDGEFSNILLTLFMTLLVFLLMSTYRILNLVTKILIDILKEDEDEAVIEEDSLPVTTPVINE